ncbi:MAG: hypothetical protein JXR03_09050 [Cyclobacteriaceae bacterium]
MKRSINSTEFRIAERWNVIKAFASVSSNGYGFAWYRVIFGTFFLFYGTWYWGWLAQIPDDLFNPSDLNLIRIFNGFPPKWVLLTADTLIVGLLLCITLGIKTRLSSLLAFLLILIMNGFAYGLGKIDHQILTNITFLTLAFSNAGTKMALVPDKLIMRRYQDHATAFFAIAIAFGIFSSGFPKAVMWIDFDFTTSGIFRWYYNGYYTLGRTELLAPFFGKIPLGVTEVFDYVIPLFEASGFFFLLKSRKHWRLWLWLLCAFHLSNVLFLNIPFTRHIMVYGLFLLPFVFEKYLPRSGKKPWIIFSFASMLAINHLIGRWLFVQGSFLILDQDLLVSLTLWIVMVLSCLPYIYSVFLRKRKVSLTN